MNQLDQLIRQFEAADYYQDDPEPRYAWRWKLIWAIAITGGIGICGCLVMAWRALG